jgi:hypothetical protein
VFDLGGTLVQWPDWEGGAATKWGLAFDALRAELTVWQADYSLLNEWDLEGL